MKLVRNIRARFKLFKNRRYLAKHGCKTWLEYHRINDPDHNPRASDIVEFYHGYPYVYCFEDYSHYIYSNTGTNDGYETMTKWFQNNLQHKWRFDFMRVFAQTPVGLDGPAGKHEFFINEIGGKDLIFVAFKDQRDYVNFLLRWA